MFGDDEWHRNHFQKNVHIEEVETSPCIKVEGRRAFSVYDGLERGSGVCPPSEDVDLLHFVVRTIYSEHPGGDLIYMRNGDGIYEYLAEGLEVSEVDTVRNNSDRLKVEVQNRQLSVTLSPVAVPAVVEVQVV